MNITRNFSAEFGPQYVRHAMGFSCEATLRDKFPGGTLPLALAGERERLKIVALEGGGRMQERLLSMGICLGDEIEVIRRQHGGSILIEKDGNRYALGGGMALKIQVIRKNDGKTIS